MNQANAGEGIGQGGRTKITTVPGQPVNYSSTYNQGINNLPKSVPVHICKLTQELMKILDQLFNSQLSRLDQAISTTIAQLPPHSKPLVPKGRLQWLVALLRLFQNTVWDQWSFRNGLTYLVCLVKPRTMILSCHLPSPS